MKNKILLLGILSLLTFSLVGCNTKTNEANNNKENNKNPFEELQDKTENLGNSLTDKVDSIINEIEENTSENTNSNIFEDITSNVVEGTENLTEILEEIESEVKDSIEKENEEKENQEVKETDYNIDYEKSINNFTSKLANAMNEKSENIVFSPFSIYTALLSSTNASTIDNESRQEILNVLGIEKDSSYRNIGYLFKNFNNRLVAKDSKFIVANSLWIDDTVNELNKMLEENMIKYFDSDIYKKDLQSKETVLDINDWITEKTNNFIKEVNIPISEETIMTLVNSVYFKGSWTNQFNKNLTTLELFKGTKTESLVDMMHNKMVRENYLETESVRAIRLNYTGMDYCMEIYIPTDKNIHITNVISDIDLNTVEFNRRLLNVNVPKFETDYELDIAKVLNQLGIKKAFKTDSKYFNLINDNAYMENVIHKAKIRVDEEGTEAAAVTIITADGTSMNTEKPLDFTVDCPFVYVIRNLNTNTIIFYGVTNNL